MVVVVLEVSRFKSVLAHGKSSCMLELAIDRCKNLLSFHKVAVILIS